MPSSWRCSLLTQLDLPHLIVAVVMFSTIYRSILASWMGPRFLQIWRAVLGLFSRRDPCTITPPTPKQRETKEEQFVKGIDHEAIRALASRYNRHLPCILDESATSQGSFNVCFFINFYTIDRTWVVRIPIKPAIHRVWEKLQSEVCSMR